VRVVRALRKSLGALPNVSLELQPEYRLFIVPTRRVTRPKHRIYPQPPARAVSTEHFPASFEVRRQRPKYALSDLGLR
jgi:hypothetical protein